MQLSTAQKQRLQNYLNFKKKLPLELWKIIDALKQQIQSEIQEQETRFQQIERDIKKELQGILQKEREQLKEIAAQRQDNIFAGIAKIKGDKGDTPKKGIDYFDGKTPKVGVDYPSKAQINQSIKSEIKPEIKKVETELKSEMKTEVQNEIKKIKIPKPKDGKTPIKGIDYFDGEKGKDADTKQITKELKKFVKEELFEPLKTQLQRLGGRRYLHGGGLDTRNVVWQEIPTGAINGTNKTFTLAYTPDTNVGKVQVKVNGIEQLEDTNYTRSGQTITFVTAPATGMSIWVNYIKR